MSFALIVIRMLSFFTSPNKAPEPATLAAGPAFIGQSAFRRTTPSTLTLWMTKKLLIQMLFTAKNRLRHDGDDLKLRA
jgi:hypothetical protein